MGSVESKQYHVFISHSSQDRKWAEMACAELERRGIGCWIAPRDITPGTTFHSLDGTGKRSIWLGLYKFEDGVLQLCYREGGLARSRPESFSYFGERMTTYVKLRRQVGPRMN